MPNPLQAVPTSPAAAQSLLATSFTATPASCLQVINGPVYALALNGSGYKPKLNLSFLSYDFGPCHVFQQGMTPAVARLVITNEDRQPVSFDAVFDYNENWQVGPPAHWSLMASSMHPKLGQACNAPSVAFSSRAHPSQLIGGLCNVFCRWLVAPRCCSQAKPRKLASPSFQQQQRSTPLQCRCGSWGCMTSPYHSAVREAV